jgi:Asp-tRNA(Asn)/Glu-tRNA(Gln) amidotransferase B subunit
MTLNDPKVKRLISALKLGDFVEEACAYAPITQDTYYRWLREGLRVQQKIESGETITAEDSQIIEMADALREAEMAGQHAALAVIREAAKDGTWQAAAWFLERRNKKWSNRTEITGPDGGPIISVSVEDVDAKIRNLIDASKADSGITTDTSKPA